MCNNTSHQQSAVQTTHQGQAATKLQSMPTTLHIVWIFAQMNGCITLHTSMHVHNTRHALSPQPSFQNKLAEATGLARNELCVWHLQRCLRCPWFVLLTMNACSVMHSATNQLHEINVSSDCAYQVQLAFLQSITLATVDHCTTLLMALQWLLHVPSDWHLVLALPCLLGVSAKEHCNALLQEPQHNDMTTSPSCWTTKLATTSSAFPHGCCLVRLASCACNAMLAVCEYEGTLQYIAARGTTQ